MQFLSSQSSATGKTEHLLLLGKKRPSTVVHPKTNPKKNPTQSNSLLPTPKTAEQYTIMPSTL